MALFLFSELMPIRVNQQIKLHLKSWQYPIINYLDDNEGKIKSARAVRFDMFGKMNVTEAHLDAIRRKSVLADQLAIDQMDDNTRSIETKFIQVILCQKHSFLHELIQNMTTDCSNCFLFWHSEQFDVHNKVTQIN